MAGLGLRETTISQLQLKKSKVTETYLQAKADGFDCFHESRVLSPPCYTVKDPPNSNRKTDLASIPT